MMENLKKEKVRLNRDRIRKNIQTSLIRIEEQDSTGPLNRFRFQHQQQKPQPNSSETFGIFDGSSYLNHIFPCSTFETIFELLQKIGQGSHSELYKCRELKSGTIFAVKLFLFLQPQNMRHVKQHYRIKKLLNHQNIIKADYLFFHIEKKRMAIVMEYCPFGTLRSFLSKNPNISNQTFAKIIYKILNVISYMHRNGVCHRDLKPENIMYSAKTGVLKIIDFELAKMQKYVNKKLQMWTITGSLHYKAPQMFKGCYNEAIDMWAFGVIIYEMIYGTLPFRSEYVSDTIVAICQTQPNYEGAQVHPSLLSIVKRCLIKNPQKRLKATDALKSPFILQFTEGMLSPGPCKKRKSNTDNQEQKTESDYRFKLKQVSKESYSEDDERSQNTEFIKDLGIRLSEKL